MALTETTYLYEILVRVNEDSSYAAQYQDISVIKKDGEVIGSTVGPALPVDSAAGAASGVLEQLLGEALATNTAMISAQKTEIESLRAELARLQDAVSA